MPAVTVGILRLPKVGKKPGDAETGAPGRRGTFSKILLFQHITFLC